MTPLDYLLDVCRTLSQFALPGRFTATLEHDDTHQGLETSPVDFHGDIHGRSYSVTYNSTPGEFGLTLLAGATQNGVPLVRLGLSSMPTGRRVVVRDYLCAGTEDDSKRLSMMLAVVLSAGSPQDFRDVS